MRVAIKVSIDLFKSDENRSQHRVNIKPIHVKIEWISIQNRADINLKLLKIDLKTIKSCSWSEQISAPKSIGEQPKFIQNLVRKSFKNRFLEPCWLKVTPPWSHLGPR